jgi:hypothetical protein
MSEKTIIWIIIILVIAIYLVTDAICTCIKEVKSKKYLRDITLSKENNKSGGTRDENN